MFFIKYMDLEFKLILCQDNMESFRKQHQHLEPFYTNYATTIYVYEHKKDFDLVRYRKVPWSIIKKLPIKTTRFLTNESSTTYRSVNKQQTFAAHHVKTTR